MGKQHQTQVFNELEHNYLNSQLIVHKTINPTSPFRNMARISSSTSTSKSTFSKSCIIATVPCKLQLDTYVE